MSRIFRIKQMNKIEKDVDGITELMVQNGDIPAIKCTAVYLPVILILH